MMETLAISAPFVEFVTMVFTSQRGALESYLLWILSVWGIRNAFGVLLSLVLQPIMGFEYLSHYQERYGELQQK